MRLTNLALPMTRAALATAAAIAAATVISHAQTAPPSAPPPPPPPPAGHARPATMPTSTLSGTVRSFNYGPRGEAEGIILSGEGDKVMQVNVPPPAGAVVAQSVNVGDAVTVTAVPRLGMPDHPVYDLVSLKDKEREFRVPRPGQEKLAHAEGAVKSLNYDREGRVSGATLEGGEFVHFGPGAAALNVSVGQRLTVDGMGRPTITGRNVIDAMTVSGVALRTLDGERGPRRDGPMGNALPGSRPDDDGPGGPRPPHGPRGARGPRDGDRGPGPDPRGEGPSGGPGGPPPPGADGQAAPPPPPPRQPGGDGVAPAPRTPPARPAPAD